MLSERGARVLAAVRLAVLEVLYLQADGIEAIPAWRRAQTEARALLGEDGSSLIRDLVDGIWKEQARAGGGEAPGAGS